MEHSKLDEIYSLSNKITRKEMVSRYTNYDQISISHKSEVMKYIDIYTGKVQTEISIVRKECPLCFSKNYSYLFTKHGFDHVLCQDCELIFVLQVLDHKKIKFLEQGNEGDNYGMIKTNKVVNENDKKKFEIIFEQLEKYTKINTIFDFGSQVGTFLDWASVKYDIIGHEYHGSLRKTAQSKGHTVLNEDLASIKFEKEFDLITCWDYLDHVLNPHEVIANLTKYLKKNGLFFFAINNKDSLSARVMHKDSPMFIGPHHTMHYGLKQLKYLMKDYKFLHAESYVSELNWISNWLNFENPEFGDTPLMYDLFDPVKVCELGMGIKLNAVFQKTD